MPKARIQTKFHTTDFHGISNVTKYANTHSADIEAATAINDVGSQGNRPCLAASRSSPTGVAETLSLFREVWHQENKFRKRTIANFTCLPPAVVEAS